MTITARLPRKLTVDAFLAFYETRPDEEQWQLVDRVAILMTPHFLTHQRLARNLERLLNDALSVTAPHLSAEQRVGIELPEFAHYRPEPDVAVIDFEIRPRRRYVDRFYLAAEILSDSDDERIELKRGFYSAHVHNREKQSVELDVESADQWASEVLSGPEAILKLPTFGLTCRLRDLYKNTPVGPD